ncbi:MAG TPA: LPXTG cell wall anchor domain-containing protein, partial [Lentzea sp.]
EQKATDQDDKISEFYVKVPENADKGEAKMNVSASVTLEKGRLFVAQDDSYKTQSLVIAQNTKVKVAKEAKADWTKAEQTTTPSTPSSTPETTTPTTTTTTSAAPAPGGSTDDLASTGASILWPLVGGLALVGAGVGALFVVRRKKAGAAE